MIDLEIAYRSPVGLHDNPRNVRTHSARQIRQIARSITAFGFANPVLVDDGDVLIAGHGRLAAARQLGLARAPVIRLSHLSVAQKRGLMLADNRISENAGWDAPMLARELSDLSSIELDFDIDVTGFDMAEIDIVIEGIVTDRSGAHPDAWRLPADEIEALLTDCIRTRLTRPDAALSLIQDASATEIPRASDQVACINETPACLALIERVDIKPGSLTLILDRHAMAQTLECQPARINRAALVLKSSFRMRRRGIELKMHLGDVPTEFDRDLGAEHHQSATLVEDDHRRKNLFPNRHASGCLQTPGSGCGGSGAAGTEYA